MIYAWCYFGNGCKDFILPVQDGVIRELSLLRAETGWAYDLMIPVRCLDNKYYVQAPEEYRWADYPATVRELPISIGEKPRLQASNHEIGFFFQSFQLQNTVFRKFLFPNGARVSLGRSESSTIVLRDAVISLSHSTFVKTADGKCLYEDTSKNGSYVNGKLLLQKKIELCFGDVLAFASGLKIVYLDNALAINSPDGLESVALSQFAAERQTALQAEGQDKSAYIHYHRSPRLMTRAQSGSIEIESPLPKTEFQEIPLILTIGPSMTMVLPMLMGSMMTSMQTGRNTFMSAGIAMIGTSSLLAIGWGIVNMIYRKKQRALSEDRRVELYRQYLSETDNTLQSMREQELQRLNEAFPNYTEYLAIIQHRSRRLWERTPLHSDFLCVRLGLGEVPLPVTLKTSDIKLSLVDDPLRDEPLARVRDFQIIRGAPLTLSLREETVIGILGENTAQYLAQGILMQLAAAHSYHDVRFVILCREQERSTWNWVRWLPHIYLNEDRSIRMLASKHQDTIEVLSRLDEIITQRKDSQIENEDEKKRDNELPLPHFILLCTDPYLWNHFPGLKRMYASNTGLTMIQVSSNMELLPKECRYIINVAENPGSLYETEGTTAKVQVEIPTRNEVEAFARQLAPVRLLEIAENAAIPSLVTFLDLYNVRDVQALDVWRFWNENKAYEGLKSTIGLASGSRPFVLDISEKLHGPHGLVAGTTGSGKSVMLQTYILSLMLNYSPKQVQFVLIDYKGGGMADAFKDMPHIVGLIDNLQSDRIIYRALSSIQGEIRRREEIFRRCGVNNIDDYIRQFNNDPDEEPLAHLIIIADEFAELKQDQPDFMHELVSASRVGRSVGIHLILATQKPSNSVDDEIWSNTRFRVCLRVQGRGDSMDMLKRPDAAYIKGMGRCFVQVGNDEIFEQVQTSWSGATYAPNEPLPDELPYLLDDIGRRIRFSQPQQLRSEPKLTQMDAVLQRIRQTAALHSIRNAKQLWMEELPRALDAHIVHDFAAYDEDGWAADNDSLSIPFALADDVISQRHIPVEMDILRRRNHMIIGQSMSGKTTLIQTLAATFAMKYNPGHVQMYVLSLGSHSLASLSSLPHVGDVMFGEDIQEIGRLIDMLTDMNSFRKDLFSQSMTDNLHAYNQYALEKKLPLVPRIIVFVDRIGQLTEILTEIQMKRFSNLVKDGSSRGIYFVISALSLSEVPPRLRDSFTGVALQLPDRSDYSEVIKTRIPLDMATIADFPGRGIAVIEGIPFEMQCAVLSSQRSDSFRSQELLHLGQRMKASWQGPIAPAVPRIPSKPKWDEFEKTEAFAGALSTPWLLPLGYNNHTAHLESVKLDQKYAWPVIGGAGTGKTNTLLSVARAFKNLGASIHVLGGPQWIGFSQEEGYNYYDTKDIAWENFFSEFIEEVKHRNQEKKKALAQSVQQHDELVAAFQPIVLIIDDIDKLLSSINKTVTDLLTYLCDDAAKYQVYFIASMTPYGFQQNRVREPIAALVRRQYGLVLGPRLSDCDVWSISVPLAMRNKQMEDNEALLIDSGVAVPLVLPLALAE